MIHFGIPREKKAHIILNTDAKTEVDDQGAIVHALLSEAIKLGEYPASELLCRADVRATEIPCPSRMDEQRLRRRP